MEYSINGFARISGVSTRTLRYYDQIGLLSPRRSASNGYRIYGQSEVDLLQQILFYRELGFSLDEIGQILHDPQFDKEKAMKDHLSALLQRKEQIELLIENVTKTIGAMKGETTMRDCEKFEGFKQKLIDENEAAYGKEIREKYGDGVIDASNSKMKGMSEVQWKEAQSLNTQILETLKEAYEQGDPAGEAAQRACALHKKWLCMFWEDGAYSKEGHKALANGYLCDERFKAYYDRAAAGCTAFFRDAIYIYCS